jgi:hypothetical protein
MLYASEEFDNNLVKLIRNSDRDGEGKHACYKECCDHAEEMSWHLYGEKPVELLERSRPREPEEVRKYRLDNYEPTTKSAADKAINVVSKIFNPNLYSIRWKNMSTSAEELKKYSLEYYPNYNSIVNFTKDVLLRKMLADPNAVTAVKPNIPYKQDEEGNIRVNDAEAIKPEIFIYGSKNVWDFNKDHYLIFTDKEQEKSGQKTITWFYFDYYDKTQYVKFRAYATPNNQLEVEEIEKYQHEFGEIPVWRLQGISESKDNGEIIYKSFFASAAPFWNLAIIHESDVLGAYINHMHPLRWEIAEDCNFSEMIEGMRVSCRGGTIKNPKTGEETSCSSCGGTGTKSMGPYGIIKIPKTKLDPDLGISTPIDYVNVPTDATKMLEERAARMEEKGLWAINMDVENNVGEVQSGVAKAIDRSAQYDTLFNIATVVFDIHITNFFFFFNLYMNGVKDSSLNKDTDDNLPEINKPTQFDIAGTPELINNLKAAKESGLDSSVLNIKEQEILTRDFSTNPDLKLFAQKMLDLDPLPGMTTDDISIGQMKGFISQVDAVIHFNKKRFIEKAISERSDFLSLPKSEQIEILEKYGQEFLNKNKPKLDTSMLNPTKQA